MRIVMKGSGRGRKPRAADGGGGNGEAGNGGGGIGEGGEGEDFVCVAPSRRPDEGAQYTM